VAGFVDDLAAASGSDELRSTIIADDSSSRKTRRATDKSIDHPGTTVSA